MNEKQLSFLCLCMHWTIGCATGASVALLLNPEFPNSISPSVLSCWILGILFVEIFLISSKHIWSWDSFVYHIGALVCLTLGLWDDNLLGSSFSEFAKLYGLPYWYEILRITVLQFIYARRHV